MWKTLVYIYTIKQTEIMKQYIEVVTAEQVNFELASAEKKVECLNLALFSLKNVEKMEGYVKDSAEFNLSRPTYIKDRNYFAHEANNYYRNGIGTNQTNTAELQAVCDALLHQAKEYNSERPNTLRIDANKFGQGVYRVDLFYRDNEGKEALYQSITGTFTTYAEFFVEIGELIENHS